MTLAGDKFRINNWIRYWIHEQNTAMRLIEDIKVEIQNGGNKEVLDGGIRYFEYQVYQYQAHLDRLYKELEGL